MLKFVAVILIACSTASTFAVENGLSDPTRPSGYNVSASTDTTSNEKLKLTLIRLGNKPHAVINGKTITPGDSIAGHRLLSLQTTSATLAGPNGRTVLQLAPTLHKSSSTIPVQNR